MDSSFEMLNRSSYFPIYSYPLSVPPEISSFDSISFRPNNNNTTTDSLSYYSGNSSTYPSTTYTNSRSHSRINQLDAAGVDSTIDRCNINNSLSSLLVPRCSDRCLVCNDRSSGIHFGVLTCEACKAFFRRTSLSLYSIPQACSPIRCEINTKNRNNCPSCRFDKCKRLGMDRDNVIYGKPSKQQIHSSYHQDYHFVEQLTHLSTELIKIFQNIHSTYQTSLLTSFEVKQQIDQFGQILFQLFYEQTSQIYVNVNSSDVIHRIFILIFDSYKTYPISDYNFVEYINLQTILSVWLFVYYYETFLLKQKIPHEKLTTLIKLLDMELTKINQYYGQDKNKLKFFKINFINTFTIFSDHLQEISLKK
ncbi:unnamed protein product [Rotaria magnacalcarata]|uniref:Nuclear receptor domain-containing protein n=1 Tax=Rotaria magnacalcarata TaxID=392030 RepID=A0A819G689_9BILA|nr:unnamed protein product [Rotaria magnacalcarata]CAF2060311.1 unnamed protein product [Rotaria magnacalcarata]CAF2065399.1 unnamed protein product [Rotaria magnacalcarata]CAF2078850.1 unnamed protein product [Rotaria magnacalcarata]CAF3793723.1 unnamed protein product [Rotaria magnacalcarata]